MEYSLFIIIISSSLANMWKIINDYISIVKVLLPWKTSNLYNHLCHISKREMLALRCPTPKLLKLITMTFLKCSNFIKHLHHNQYSQKVPVILKSAWMLYAPLNLERINLITKWQIGKVIFVSLFIYLFPSNITCVSYLIQWKNQIRLFNFSARWTWTWQRDILHTLLPTLWTAGHVMYENII
jgi:hypothetical protein